MRFTQTQLAKIIKETEYSKLRSKYAKIKRGEKDFKSKVGAIPIEQGQNIGHYYKQIGHKTRSSWCEQTFEYIIAEYTKGF